MSQSVIDFLSQEEFEQRAEQMIEGIKAEAKALNRPVYFGDGKSFYEQWPNGKKYVLVTDEGPVNQS